MRCPMCDQALASRPLDVDVSVHTCPTCAGVAVPVNGLVRLLGEIARPLKHVIQDDEPIEPILDSHALRGCPKCGQTMTPFGYMGTNLVTADRCDADQLIWTDGDELGTMALLLLRTERRTKTRQSMHTEMRESMARHTRLALSNRRRANTIATGLILGG